MATIWSEKNLEVKNISMVMIWIGLTSNMVLKIWSDENMELKNIFGHHSDCEVVQKREAGGKAAIVKPKAGPVLVKSYVVRIVRQS